MNAIRGPRAGVATIWFVTAAQPLDVLVAEPGHDRGFGRKYLALLDPRLTVTPIGDFPLNRSAPAGSGEFYIGGFDGLAVVQTVLEDVSRPSQLPDRYLRGIAATDVYVFSSDPVTGFGAFAHWRAGVLKRAFSATRFTIIEDTGVPEVFEGDFWAGRRRPEEPETPEDATGTGSPLARGVAMPFVPAELADAAVHRYSIVVEGAVSSYNQLAMGLSRVLTPAATLPNDPLAEISREADFEMPATYPWTVEIRR